MAQYRKNIQNITRNILLRDTTLQVGKGEGTIMAPYRKNTTRNILLRGRTLQVGRGELSWHHIQEENHQKHTSEGYGPLLGWEGGRNYHGTIQEEYHQKHTSEGYEPSGWEGAGNVMAPNRKNIARNILLSPEGKGPSVGKGSNYHGTIQEEYSEYHQNHTSEGYDPLGWEGGRNYHGTIQEEYHQKHASEGYNPLGWEGGRNYHGTKQEEYHLKTTVSCETSLKK